MLAILSVGKFFSFSSKAFIVAQKKYEVFLRYLEMLELSVLRL